MKKQKKVRAGLAPATHYPTQYGELTNGIGPAEHQRLPKGKGTLDWYKPFEKAPRIELIVTLPREIRSILPDASQDAAQMKQMIAQDDLELLKSLTFWQRLKFVFNPNNSCPTNLK